MQTCPAQVSNMGKCIGLTQKSPLASFLQTAQPQLLHLLSSTMASLAEVPQKSFLTCTILLQYSPRLDQSTASTTASTWVPQPSLLVQWWDFVLSWSLAHSPGTPEPVLHCLILRFYFFHNNGSVQYRLFPQLGSALHSVY